MKKRLAVFDFDGTITHKDSFLEFMKFYRGHIKFYLGFGILSPIMGLFFFKILPNWKAKEAALKYFFKGESLEFFNRRCEDFSREVLPSMIKDSALEAIEAHRKNGDTIIVVSASAENWLSNWCRKYDLELIATKLEIQDGKITGKLSGRNCYGDEKECRLRAHVNLDQYQEIYVYGDSSGDKALLKLATHPFYRHFN